MSYPFSNNFNQSKKVNENQLVELNSNHVLQNSEVFQKVGEHVRNLKTKSMNIHKNIPFPQNIIPVKTNSHAGKLHGL